MATTQQTAKTTNDFKCGMCDARTESVPVRGFRNALAFVAWFERQGWTSEGGRPLCGACKCKKPEPPPPPPPPPASGVRRVCVSSNEIVNALAESVATLSAPKPLEVLADVAKRLAPFGEVRIDLAFKMLFLDGEAVLNVNPSGALVLCQIIRGVDRVADAANVTKAAGAAEIASLVLARVAKGGRRAA